MLDAVSGPAPSLEAAFADDRAFLWSLSYRLTGNAADADDIVQETFTRALASPPPDTTAAWRPWLVRVAVNLGRDLLRLRRRRGYPGTWLPSPVPTDGVAPPEPRAPSASEPSARYDLVESASLAFLLALEALTATQRAVLVLRDVFDYSVKETAAALGQSEAGVKTTHLRARRAVASYDARRRPPTAERRARAADSLARFLDCLSRGDAPGAEALLAADVRALSDGGGVYAAARHPIEGRDRVLALYLGLSRHTHPLRVETRELSGAPAVVFEVAPRPGFAPRFVVTADVDDDGRITALYTVLAPAKLRAV